MILTALAGYEDDPSKRPDYYVCAVDGGSNKEAERRLLRVRIRIEDDGTPQGSRVVNADTGEVIEGVRRVDFHMRPYDRPVATIELEGVELQVKPRRESLQVRAKFSRQGSRLRNARLRRKMGQMQSNLLAESMKRLDREVAQIITRPDPICECGSMDCDHPVKTKAVEVQYDPQRRARSFDHGVTWISDEALADSGMREMYFRKTGVVPYAPKDIVKTYPLVEVPNLPGASGTG